MNDLLLEYKSVLETIRDSEIRAEELSLGIINDFCTKHNFTLVDSPKDHLISINGEKHVLTVSLGNGKWDTFYAYYYHNKKYESLLNIITLIIKLEDKGFTIANNKMDLIINE